MNSRFMWFGRHEGWLRHLAHGVKSGDEECLRKAAGLFDLMLPDRCVVVPMPSHNGMAEDMLKVIDHMPCGKRYVMNALTCVPHESSRAQKLAGFAPSPIAMSVDSAMVQRMLAETSDEFYGGVYVIDNVICSGTTASAAIRALNDIGLDAKVVSLTYATWR